MVDYILLEEYTQHMHVLFVEDDESIRQETHELLMDIFPYVDVAQDGEEGLYKYQTFMQQNQEPYDLVITDIQMPKMNGIELTKAIYEAYRKQPLIVLSAHSDSQYLMQLVNIGISQFITKPIELNNFVRIIFNISKEIFLQKNQDQKIDYSVIRISSDCQWDKKRLQLIQNGEDVKLTKKEILLLCLLLKFSEKTYTVEEIIAFVWKDEQNSSPDVKNLKNIISRLRKKLPSLDIENVYGFGYKINLH
jgi:DNA-binding response OmpR family regulator